MSSGRWQGLQRLVEDAVDAGSRAIETVQLETATRPFAILERVSELAPASRAVHTLFKTAVSGTHSTIRLVNQTVGLALRPVLERIEGTAPRSR